MVERSEVRIVLKKQATVRRHEPTAQVPVLGIAIGMMLFLGVQMVSPHPGQSCTQLGQMTEEWQLGLPTQSLICGATLAGDLRYDRAVTKQRKITLP
jgi:hypothetical protein